MLNNNVLEDLKMLQNIISGIYDNHEKLLKLEQINKKDTLEYKEILKELESSLALEKSIVKRLTSNKTLIDEILKHLKASTNNFEILGNQVINKEQLTMTRLINYLSVEGINYSIEEKEYSNEEELMSDSFELAKIYNYYLMCDISNLSLKIMSDNFKNNEKELLHFKYDYSMMVPIITEAMVESSFEIPEQVYSIYKLANSFYPGLQMEKDNLFKDGCLARIIAMYYNFLINLNDDNLYDPKAMGYAISAEAFIRSAIVFMSKDTIETYIDMINEGLEKIKSIPFKKLIYRIISDAINNKSNDEKYVQFVSLNLGRN